MLQRCSKVVLLYRGTDNLFISGLDKSGVNIVKKAKEKFAAKATFQDYLGTAELIVDLVARWNLQYNMQQDNDIDKAIVDLNLGYRQLPDLDSNAIISSVITRILYNYILYILRIVFFY
jgi:hypothetical protein